MSDDIEQRQAELKQRARRRMIGVAVFATLLVVIVPRILERGAPASGRDEPVAATPREAPGQPESSAAASPSGGREAGGRIATGSEAQAPSAANAQPAPAANPVPAAATTGDATTTPRTETAPAGPAAAPVASAVERISEPSARSAPAAPVPEAAQQPRPTPVAHATQEKPHAAAAKTGSDVPKSVASSAKAPAPKGGFLVQVGVFSDPDKARQLESRLAAKDFRVHSDTVTIASAVRTRVRVGPFATHAEAEKAVARLVAINEPAIIVKP